MKYIYLLSIMTYTSQVMTVYLAEHKCTHCCSQDCEVLSAKALPTRVQTIYEMSKTQYVLLLLAVYMETGLCMLTS